MIKHICVDMRVLNYLTVNKISHIWPNLCLYQMNDELRRHIITSAMDFMHLKPLKYLFNSTIVIAIENAYLEVVYVLGA